MMSTWTALLLFYSCTAHRREPRGERTGSVDLPTNPEAAVPIVTGLPTRIPPEVWFELVSGVVSGPCKDPLSVPTETPTEKIVEASRCWNAGRLWDASGWCNPRSSISNFGDEHLTDLDLNYFAACTSPHDFFDEFALAVVSNPTIEWKSWPVVPRMALASGLIRIERSQSALEVIRTLDADLENEFPRPDLALAQSLRFYLHALAAAQVGDREGLMNALRRGCRAYNVYSLDADYSPAARILTWNLVSACLGQFEGQTKVKAPIECGF